MEETQKQAKYCARITQRRVMSRECAFLRHWAGGRGGVERELKEDGPAWNRLAYHVGMKRDKLKDLFTYLCSPWTRATG